MSTAVPHSPHRPRPADPPQRALACPLALQVDAIGALLNCEIADHPVYSALELQAFDDEEHGRGLLAFLQRRDGGLVDYYVEPGLVLDRSGYEIGGGTRSWTTRRFEAARLVVDERGVDAEVRFTDVEGRTIEVRVSDRAAGPARRGRLLAPVGAGIERPASLLLVLLDGFDLVRRTREAPVIRIDGVQVSTGRLPGAALHRRHLIKYAAPLVAVSVNPGRGGRVRLVTGDEDDVELRAGGIAAVTGTRGAHSARLRLAPPLPDLAQLADGESTRGAWTVDVDGTAITGGTWTAARVEDDAVVFLDVTRPWRPGPLPLLMRVVTRVMPVFRSWPTTYRWTATVHLGAEPTMSARWERTETGTGEAYLRATGSA
jgi:hypothetical protein